MRDLFFFFEITTALRGCILFVLMMAFSGESFAMICMNNTGGTFDGNGSQSFRIRLSPEVKPNQPISVLNVADFVKCMNQDYSGGNNYDYVKLTSGSGFAQSIESKTYGRIIYYGREYQSPITGNGTVYYSVYLPGTWQGIPAQLILYPEPGVFGKLIHAGELVAILNVQKEATYGQDAGISNFTWRFYSDTDVYVQTGTCSVSSHNVQVTLSDYPAGPVPVPLTVQCNESRQVSYTLSGKTDRNNNSIFSNTLANGAGGVGIQLLDSAGNAVAAGQKKYLGQVGPSTSLNIGLRASYALTNGQTPPTPGRVQALVDVTFEYN